MKSIMINPIGVIHTPHKEIGNMPIQPIAAKGIKGYVEVFSEYISGLQDLKGFSHIMLLYYFHKVKGYDLMVKPFMDNKERGIFACRAPKRPNAIGTSIVRLINVEKNTIYFEEADMLDETPLIDIKPFFPKFDNRENATSGWLKISNDVQLNELRSDERFKMHE